MKNLFECDLCTLEKKTKWHYESEKIVICNCMTCKTPMVLLKRHTMSPTQEELDEIKKACDEWFGEGEYKFRIEQRRIPDHMHWHLIFEK